MVGSYLHVQDAAVRLLSKVVKVQVSDTIPYVRD
jgi:hypothetical protein